MNLAGFCNAEMMKAPKKAGLAILTGLAIILIPGVSCRQSAPGQPEVRAPEFPGEGPEKPGTGDREAQGPAPLPFGVKDTGIFSELDGLVVMELPACAAGGNVSLAVNKKKRVLSLSCGKVPVKAYPVALGSEPKGTKLEEGDGKTPEGTYRLVSSVGQGLPAGAGGTMWLISYPSARDAAMALESGRLGKDDYDAVAKAEAEGLAPPQGTVLGGGLGLHGGGVSSDWTGGGIALRDGDFDEISGVVGPGTPITIVSGDEPDPEDADGDGIPDQVDIHLGALKCALNKASYDSGYQKIAYPLGDVDREKGCCTDVIIRAFRNAGMDLQAEIHKDILARKKAYKHVPKPNTDIDHRRVRNMIIYMQKHMVGLDASPDEDAASGWLPGDVVYFDTLPKKGPDHVGILTSALDGEGRPMVINNWYWGSKTAAMDLVSGWPVTHRFRIH